MYLYINKIIIKISLNTYHIQLLYIIIQNKEYNMYSGLLNPYILQVFLVRFSTNINISFHGF